MFFLSQLVQVKNRNMKPNHKILLKTLTNAYEQTFLLKFS